MAIKIASAIILVTLIASCQPKPDINQILSNSDIRKQIMDSISNDHALSKEMMESMMNSEHGKMTIQGDEKITGMMMQNHETMMKMMKDNPGMMQSMMSDMMEACKGDTSMIASMCKSMMESKEMMDMMHKMENGKMDMDKMKGKDHKSN